MSVKKRIIIIAASALGGLCLLFLCVFFFYYPHYRSAKKQLTYDPGSEAKQVCVMSCNIRCLNPSDLGKKSWFYRADLILKNIELAKPDVIGFQEVTSAQYSYLTDTLTDFESVVQYRDSTPFAESCPVFYRTDRFSLTDKGSFWLSETPEYMSRDWGSKYYRICSYVILKENSSGKEFAVFNTHLDNVSDKARINGINVILEKRKEFGSLPCLIIGDFNARENSKTYEAAQKVLLDAKYQTDDTDEGATYQAFGKTPDADCIDYIFVSRKGFRTDSFKIIRETYDGAYPSDHFQLVGRFTLTSGKKTSK